MTFTRCAFATAVTCGVLFFGRPAAAAPLLVVPSSQTVNTGEALTLDFSISDVTDLFSYQFDITFDPSVLRADLVLNGGFLTSAGGSSFFESELGIPAPFVLTLDNALGLITILDLLTGPVPTAVGVNGTGVLASIAFTSLAAGNSTIVFSNVLLGNSIGDAIAADTEAGRVTVVGPKPVPEPGTLLLLSTGVVLGFCRRRFSRVRRLRHDTR